MSCWCKTCTQHRPYKHTSKRGCHIAMSLHSWVDHHADTLTETITWHMISAWHSENTSSTMLKHVLDAATPVTKQHTSHVHKVKVYEATVEKTTSVMPDCMQNRQSLNHLLTKDCCPCTSVEGMIDMTKSMPKSWHMPMFKIVTNRHARQLHACTEPWGCCKALRETQAVAHAKGFTNLAGIDSGPWSRSRWRSTHVCITRSQSFADSAHVYWCNAESPSCLLHACNDMRTESIDMNNPVQRACNTVQCWLAPGLHECCKESRLKKACVAQTT